MSHFDLTEKIDEIIAKKNYDSGFEEIAINLINQKTLKVNEEEFQIVGIEFYLNRDGKNNPLDIFAHEHKTVNHIDTKQDS
ncbi:hypothetical protein R9C00_16900 [Flammeovirgaceae bacterium SG7u.111]|nr:hypothetical protein [Flammeovirgaceae bacterium SG7u.132]WPO33379.1 hypothetical protein R9C00_16900 [Flammeovirgaceae bacterium SG7u.111]